MNPPNYSLQSLVLLLAILALVGCSEAPKPKRDPAHYNLYRIAQAYERASVNHPPQSVEQIKKILRECYPPDEAESILRSPRDGEPYVIIAGSRFDVESDGIILVYERRGSEGKRQVLTTARRYALLTDEEFARATFANSHRPETKP
jgi:uncharacterized lipoprotein